MEGWLTDMRVGESKAFLFLLAGVSKPLSVMSMLAITKNKLKL